MLHCFLRVCIVLVLLTVNTGALAYVPALPTNDTSRLPNPMNATQSSRLHLQWYSNGSLWNDISYQLAGPNSSGITQGALVHVSENHMSNLTVPTTTPWIALVSCDFNATNASNYIDIFTLARDKGAVSALLFTEWSQTCVINEEYLDLDIFEQVLDVFVTPTLTSSQVIMYQFGQYGILNSTAYLYYDSGMLNQSASSINESIVHGAPVAPGYLLATMQAFNATPTSSPSSGGPSPNSMSNNDSSNTGLAMIILYAITGCVSALFCVVIISGAIRAIRHPERYGPRTGIQHGGITSAGQSRARGLTRAILDTFPIVKFGYPSDVESNGQQSSLTKDVEPRSESSEVRGDSPENTAVEMHGWEIVNKEVRDEDDVKTGKRAVSATPHSTGWDVASNEGSSSHHERNVSDDATHHHHNHHARQSSTGTGSQSHEQGGADNHAEASTSTPSKRRASQDNKDVMPDAIGRETCPICIVDFEEGDDLRVLPCEGKHRFHQQCVDPWLLELSSSCPICRQDFLALENMLWGESNRPGPWHPGNERESHRMSAAASGSHGNRFSRYLKSARRRHREHTTYSPQPET